MHDSTSSLPVPADLDPRLRRRKDWSAGVVHTSGRTGALFITLFAVFWCAITFTVAGITLLGKGDKPVPATAYIVLIFPAIGVFLLWGTFYAWQSHRRWGQSVLRLERFPPRLGGVLRGVVEVSRPIEASDSVRKQVRCVRITKRRSGNKTETRRDTLWENEAFLEVGATSLRQGKVNVAFRLPADQPIANPGQVQWELVVTAKTPGPDYRAVFDLPVLEAQPGEADNDPLLPHANEALKPPALERVLAEFEPKILLSEIAGSTRFEMPAGRHKGFSLGFAAIGLALLVGAWAMWAFEMPMCIALFIIAFGLMFAYIGLTATFTSRKLSVARSGVEVESATFGFPRHRMIAPEQISSVSVDKTASAGETTYYNVKLSTVDGKRVTLAHMIRSRPAAQGIADRINRVLGRAAEGA